MRTLVTALLLALAGCGEKKVEVVPLDKLPAPVLQAAKEKLPDVTFETAWKTADGNYEVRGKEKSGKVRDVRVTPAGKIVEVD